MMEINITYTLDIGHKVWTGSKLGEVIHTFMTETVGHTIDHTNEPKEVVAQVNAYLDTLGVHTRIKSLHRQTVIDEFF